MQLTRLTPAERAHAARARAALRSDDDPYSRRRAAGRRSSGSSHFCSPAYCWATSAPRTSRRRHHLHRRRHHHPPAAPSPLPAAPPPAAAPPRRALPQSRNASATYDATCRFSLPPHPARPRRAVRHLRLPVAQDPVPVRRAHPTTASTGDAPSGASTVVLELDLGPFTTPSSTTVTSRPTGQSPRSRPPTSSPPSRSTASPTADGAFAAHPFSRQHQRHVDACRRPPGVHAALSRATRLPPPNAAYATLEAANAVGAVDLSTGRVLGWSRCRSRAPPPANRRSSPPTAPAAAAPARDGWRCYRAPMPPSHRTAGGRPAGTLAEDRDGNIWDAQDRRPRPPPPLTADGPPEWWIQGSASARAPFTSRPTPTAPPSGSTRSRRSTSSTSAAAASPPSCAFRSSTSGFGFGPPVSLSDLLRCPPDGDDDGPRPASARPPARRRRRRRPLPKGGRAVSVHAPGTADGCAARPDPYASAALVDVAAGCWAARARAAGAGNGRAARTPPSSTWRRARSATARPSSRRSGSPPPPTTLRAAAATRRHRRRPPLQPDVLLRAADVDLGNLEEAWRGRRCSRRHRELAPSGAVRR